MGHTDCSHSKKDGNLQWLQCYCEPAAGGRPHSKSHYLFAVLAGGKIFDKLDLHIPSLPAADPKWKLRKLPHNKHTLRIGLRLCMCTSGDIEWMQRVCTQLHVWTSWKQLGRFLSHYNKFRPNLSTIQHTINTHLQQQYQWHWSAECL